MYKGLHFSKHDTFVTIIWNELPGIIPLEEAKEFAIRFLPQLVSVFEKNKLDDEFAFSSEFNDLYTELTGTIAIWMEDMSFYKEQYLRANIEAIKLSFQMEKENRLPTEDKIKALKQYSGFGALKCILNPVEKLADIAQWSDSKVGLFPAVMELHDVLETNA